jgi:lysophospholipase
MQDAPLLDNIAGGPPDGRAVWRTTQDGVRVRIVHWPSRASKGTVLLFPGRTEFAEKYGRAAQDLSARGYGTLTIDWRGQGLSDRLADDAMSGHVAHFADYQADVAALLEVAEAIEAPRPWHLLAHSMGGAIGLRAAIEGLPVATCAFSAPMWGIRIKAALRPLAWSLGWGSRHVGLGHYYAPSTSRDSYVLSAPFKTNDLTRDTEMYAHMRAQLAAHPELALGGPSLHWLFEGLRECRRLHALPSPMLPCLTFFGTNEAIVDIARIEARMARWPGAQLKHVHGALHEPIMDTPQTRHHVWDMLAGFWGAP